MITNIRCNIYVVNIDSAQTLGIKGMPTASTQLSIGPYRQIHQVYQESSYKIKLKNQL